MDRTAVQSSNIASIGYDEPSATLEIEFSNGSIYQYFGVSIQVHAELVGAPSVGQAFVSTVRGVYPFART